VGRLDWTVFHWINGPAGNHGSLDRIAKFGAERLSVVVVATLVAAWLIVAGVHLWRDRELPRGLLTVVLVAGLSLVLAYAANQVIGHFWFRPRPYDRHAGAHLIAAPSPDPSFASDHATAGFALAFGAAAGLPVGAALVFVETVVMSVARVYVGLHYPGDMLGGMGVALGAAFVSWSVVRLAAGVIDRAVELVNGYAGRRGWPVRLR